MNISQHQANLAISGTRNIPIPKTSPKVIKNSTTNSSFQFPSIQKKFSFPKINTKNEEKISFPKIEKQKSEQNFSLKEIVPEFKIQRKYTEYFEEEFCDSDNEDMEDELKRKSEEQMIGLSPNSRVNWRRYDRNLGPIAVNMAKKKRPRVLSPGDDELNLVNF
jgi:hypothetical protein